MSNINSLHAIFLGIIQGITEFLPISSSAHLVIFQHYLKGFQQPGLLFDVMLHLGTLLAVIIYFHKEISKILESILKWGEEKDHELQRRKVLLILIGTIPTGIIGVLFKEDLERAFSSLALVGAMLVFTGLFLALSDRVVKGGRKYLTVFNAFLIGVVQGIAILPGISRSGSTIAAGILLGIEREEAVQFSFLLSIPAILGAFVLEMGEFSLLPRKDLVPYILGIAFAFALGLLAIDVLMRVVKNRNLIFFACYCWVVGGIILYSH